MREDAFAVHEVDEYSEYIERFSFRFIEKEKVERVFLALYNQRVMKSYSVVESEDEPYRRKYTNYRVTVTMKNIDHKLVSHKNLVRMITELFFAMGYELHFIRWSRFLNLKARYE